ncbi:RNA polymerase sigma factor [Corynebacterium sp. TAE3-ERU12]|uniref:RNA polymerase sigma factor n=1 Tax=Corynebacterium sp. TAE3-ERU12 TaxID=2849491 RepID=UPI001C4679AD|nr:RNA polymerase sigma factor [Corynebacterium sp. TAE3-ERU12]MBV7294460.1 RNA polymerase sigma factor [Corynebacterium sp. TAE3-ERU12]
MPQHCSEDSVTRLALQAGRGDADALSEFIRATQTDVWRFFAHLADPDIADDLTQETYLRVMGALPRFAARSSARTWLLSVARRVWVDSVRHDLSRPRKSTVTLEDATDSVVGSSEKNSSWADLVDVKILLDGLEPARREALILTQVLGYSYQEAAEIANCRVGTIRSRVSRARNDLIAANRLQGQHNHSSSA